VRNNTKLYTVMLYMFYFYKKLSVTRKAFNITAHNNTRISRMTVTMMAGYLCVYWNAKFGHVCTRDATRDSNSSQRIFNPDPKMRNTGNHITEKFT